MKIQTSNILVKDTIHALVRVLITNIILNLLDTYKLKFLGWLVIEHGIKARGVLSSNFCKVISSQINIEFYLLDLQKNFKLTSEVLECWYIYNGWMDNQIYHNLKLLFCFIGEDQDFFFFHAEFTM